MLIVKNVKIKLDYDNDYLKKRISEKLNISKNNIISFEIIKKAIDARDKTDIFYVMNFICDINTKKYQKNDDVLTYEKKEEQVIKSVHSKKSVVVIGFGPAGMFAGLILSKAGLKPIIIERGKDVSKREEDISVFLKTGKLNESSNILFGEGGAGMYSDGKLTTNIHSEKVKMVLDEFIYCGADKSIGYLSKPHIGTDELRNVIKNLRKHIVSLGGQVIFESQFKDFQEKNGRINKIYYEKNGLLEEIETNHVVLAIGHSARDTYKMLYKKNVLLSQKPFSMGVRIEQKQDIINESQYGLFKDKLEPATYKLSTHLKNGRSVYTFCMCPGGIVIPAISEKEMININGMSYHKRDGKNANSAVLVNVEPSDFMGNNPLGGIEFQRKYERLAYNLTNSYRAPAMTYKDFKNNTLTGFKDIKPSYPIGVYNADIKKCLPDFVSESIKQALEIFNKKIKNFASDDAILTAVETRSSSPVRINRDSFYNSSIKGLYPIGEGAGYAGGITSAAVDGINCALKIIDMLGDEDEI